MKKQIQYKTSDNWKIKKHMDVFYICAPDGSEIDNVKSFDIAYDRLWEYKKGLRTYKNVQLHEVV